MASHEFYTYVGHCPYLSDQVGIRIKYAVIPILGETNPGYKKINASCDYSDDCPYVNTHDGCPVFKEAPAEPY